MTAASLRIRLLMAPTLSTAQLIEAVRRRMQREDYIPLEALPPNYPAEPDEVRQVFFHPQLPVCYPSEMHRVFEHAHHLARRHPPHIFIGMMDDQVDPPCFKVYQGKEVLAKYGPNPDHELTFHAVVGNEVRFAECAQALDMRHPPLVTEWRELAQNATAPIPSDLARFLAMLNLAGVELTDYRTVDARRDTSPYLRHIWIHTSSPLY